MTYEWGYSGGPAMAVSPIGPVRRVLEYAVSEMPSSKILMGQNLYGYDWTLPFVKAPLPKQSAHSKQSSLQPATMSLFNMIQEHRPPSFVMLMKKERGMKYGLKTPAPFKQNSI